MSNIKLNINFFIFAQIFLIFNLTLLSSFQEDFKTPIQNKSPFIKEFLMDSSYHEKDLLFVSSIKQMLAEHFFERAI